MDKDLKLFVWKNVLSDYTDGVAFALAKTVEEAREMLLKVDIGVGTVTELLASEIAHKKPEIYTSPMAWFAMGGG